MTADEYRRLDAIERRLGIHEEQERIEHEHLKSMDRKIDKMAENVDRLLVLYAMGRGAFWFFTRSGAILGALGTAFYWASDHFHWWQK